MDLENAIRRVQGGDASAFEGVVRAFEWPIRAYAVSRCPPGGDADDVAQRTFIAAFRRIAEYRIGSDFKSWLFTIARYEILAESTRLRRIADYHERLAPRILLDELDRRDDPSADVRVDRLRSCMKSLDPSDRELLSRRYDEELPLEEISRRSGRSVGAIKKHLFLLRARLMDCVGSRMAPGNP